MPGERRVHPGTRVGGGLARASRVLVHTITRRSALAARGMRGRIGAPPRQPLRECMAEGEHALGGGRCSARPAARGRKWSGGRMRMGEPTS